jgi:amino acid transporter
MGFFEIGSLELLAHGGFKPWSPALCSWLARITSMSHRWLTQPTLLLLFFFFLLLLACRSAQRGLTRPYTWEKEVKERPQTHEHFSSLFSYIKWIALWWLAFLGRLQVPLLIMTFFYRKIHPNCKSYLELTHFWAVWKNLSIPQARLGRKESFQGYKR